MLNISLSSDCSLITITSTVSNYADADIETIDIAWKVNCCDTSKKTYQITDFTTPDSYLVDNSGTREIQLTPTFFSTTDAITDGIYSITIKVTKDDDSFVEEKGCVFVDCYLKCKIVDCIEQGDYEAHRLYEGIKMAIECEDTDCDCESSCEILEILQNKLGLDSKKNEKINDCGC